MLFICFMERAQRRILIQYPKRQTQRGMQAERSHLPLKINTAGVIPPIFASSLLLMPLTITPVRRPARRRARARGAISSSALNQYLQHGSPLYMALYGAGIIFFSFFYTAVVFNPEETADNLKRYGGFIPGIRPGKNTETYFDYVLTRITVIGAAYLTFICLVPEYLVSRAGDPVLPRRHQPADRGQRDDGYGDADPVPSAGAPIWRPDQEGEAEGRAPALSGAATNGRGCGVNIILLGPAGCGQGHAGERGSMRERGMVQLSTGDMLRAAVKAGTPVGLQAKAVMEAGELVSDEIVSGMIGERLDELDTAHGRDLRRLSAHRGAGGMRSTRCSPSAAARSIM